MKIALLFPGYGSQFVGMAKELYNENRIVQEYFDEASNCLDTNFLKLCFASSEIEIGMMSHAYTSIFLVSSAIYALLKEAVYNQQWLRDLILVSIVHFLQRTVFLCLMVIFIE